jgi:ketosteroid isomerase-like protein
MKLPIHFAAAALVGFATALAAFGQDAPTTLRRTPAPETSPAPATETPTPTPTPVAKTKETPAAKSAAPASAKKEEKTATAKPTPLENERAGESGAEIVTRIRQMEREWESSPRNASIINRMVSDNFLGLTSDGKVVTKRALLRNATNKPTDVWSSGHMDVRLHGTNVAVVVGGAKQTVRDKAGKKTSTSYRFTDTWMARDGKWQCIASQAIELPKK